MFLDPESLGWRLEACPREATGAVVLRSREARGCERPINEVYRRVRLLDNVRLVTGIVGANTGHARDVVWRQDQVDIANVDGRWKLVHGNERDHATIRTSHEELRLELLFGNHGC